MPRDGSSYVNDWVKIAEKDYDRVLRMLDDDDPEGAAFHLQQCLEKLLKAFLLSKGWTLNKIHDLETLMDDAERYGLSIAEYREICQTISTFYTVERYPPLVPPDLTVQNVQECLNQAQGLIELLRERTKE
mgnify:CR=1 FL=1